MDWRAATVIGADFPARFSNRGDACGARLHGPVRLIPALKAEENPGIARRLPHRTYIVSESHYLYGGMGAPGVFVTLLPFFCRLEMRQSLRIFGVRKRDFVASDFRAFSDPGNAKP